MFYMSVNNVHVDTVGGLGDNILVAVLSLLKKEVPEHGRHVQQYFQFFLMYAGLGIQEVSYVRIDCVLR